MNNNHVSLFKQHTRAMTLIHTSYLIPLERISFLQKTEEKMEEIKHRKTEKKLFTRKQMFKAIHLK